MVISSKRSWMNLSISFSLQAGVRQNPISPYFGLSM